MSTGYELTKSLLPVQRMADLESIGNAIAQSGMFGVRNAASGLVVAATCHQQGITLMDFQRTYHIIEGRPSMRSDAMLAEFRKLGGKCRIIENSVTRAAAEFTFEGQSYTFEYTLDDAKRTGDACNGKGEIKTMWQKRPEDMLWARLVSRSVRKLAPEICAGLYTPEEVSDFDDRPQGREPVILSQDEIIARAKTVDAVVVSEIEPDEYDRCPIGGEGYLGRPWMDFPVEQLRAALETPGMQPGHYMKINEAIAAKGGNDQ